MKFFRIYRKKVLRSGISRQSSEKRKFHHYFTVLKYASLGKYIKRLDAKRVYLKKNYENQSAEETR